uniref:Tf2-1-like SH3-like domain-containing protein n=1 Tax=Arundo donax TaxID=35708 RepID=A0A0A9HMQ5_ARUDO
MCMVDRQEARVPAMEQSLRERDEFLQDVRECLRQAQEQAKLYYDTKHTEVAFGVGDWVWLKLLHRPVASLSTPVKGKLAPRFCGPYQILERIGDVAYRLQLPERAKITRSSMLAF